jgi:hypothetical protein
MNFKFILAVSFFILSVLAEECSEQLHQVQDVLSVCTLEDQEQYKNMANGENVAVMTTSIRLCMCDEAKGKKVLLDYQSCAKNTVAEGKDMGVDSFCNGEESSILDGMLASSPVTKKKEWKEMMKEKGKEKMEQAKKLANKVMTEERKKKLKEEGTKMLEEAKRLVEEQAKKKKSSGVSGYHVGLLIDCIAMVVVSF